MHGALRTDTANRAFDRAEANGDQYVMRVNTEKLDMERQTDKLNEWYRRGWKLHSVFEQQGNSVMVFERITTITVSP